MTTPLPSLKFVTVDEAVARYEGVFPTDRTAWLTWRLFDVENALMGLVPSLRKPIDVIEADSEAAGDPGRLDRVKSLIVDKVLQLFRNPGNANQESQTVDDVTIARSFYRTSTTTGFAFSDDELAQVRLRSRKRSKIGSLPIDPWRITC